METSRPSGFLGQFVAGCYSNGCMADHLSVWWLAIIPGIALALGVQFMLHGIRIEREMKRCRYGKALKMLDGPLSWPSASLYKSLRADTLFFSGRAQEAETILRELVEPRRNAADRVIGLENLGRVLLAQSRYQEARQSFEAAARLTPTRSVAFSGLAEWRLLQGTGPGLALQDAERALQSYRNSLIERTAREHLAAIRGNQAWALALLGHAAESQQAIEAGAREMDPKHMPEVAGFYWRAGMAMLALENATAAAFFRRAAELDPQGYYGGLAKQRLP
jgi:tetratricopeptide (TPR) repeat protein